ncbi:glucuronosyltransferase [Sphingomonas sp. NBWT7]|uniref:glycosyltransferase n=1 Tax=Sphingomonas sp. NBWT7 TaxID=2596913 RepID=UPI0016246888|nr:glycosyltransferase [Sphingomonas sp. NBWT7]QNE31044.1 glucuronosyltransferase [Sphingomonas sp. NBWT7]
MVHPVAPSRDQAASLRGRAVMIVVTVGTQLPFDRFIRIVDRLAPQADEEVFAQTGRGEYRPVNMRWQSVVPPIEFEQMIQRCSRIVSHAGIGTIVMAQKHSKPLILFPRLGSLDEHRNDHQLATVRALDGRTGIYTAFDEADLAALITRSLAPPVPVERHPERDRLRHALTSVLQEERARLWRRSRPLA